MADEITTKIEEQLDKPKNISMGDMSISNHSISDMIAADKYISKKQATATTETLGIRIGKFKSPEHF
jgi:hypothetical protein